MESKTLQNKWKHLAGSIAFFSVIALCIMIPNWQAQAAIEKPVCAFYYAWYDRTSFGPGKTPNTPFEYYVSASWQTISRHVREAKSTGLDCFIQSWYGPGNQTESNFKMVLDSAAQNNFFATVHFETLSPFFHTEQDRIDALRLLINTHARHPAFMKLNGKPVIFFWANNHLTVSQWRDIRDQVDPNRQTIWIAEGGHSAHLAVFDGLHLYNVSWAHDFNAVQQRWKNTARNFGTGRYWMGTAMPGFDERHIPGREAHNNYLPRRNGKSLINSFKAAVASQPDILLITSYNEWVEDSHVEPSREFGDFYLKLLTRLITEYKGFGPEPVATLPPTATATPWPTSTPIPQSTATQVVWPTNTPTPLPTATTVVWPTNTPMPEPTTTVWPTNTPIPQPTNTVAWEPTQTPNTQSNALPRLRKQLTTLLSLIDSSVHSSILDCIQWQQTYQLIAFGSIEANASTDAQLKFNTAKQIFLITASDLNDQCEIDLKTDRTTVIPPLTWGYARIGIEQALKQLLNH